VPHAHVPCSRAKISVPDGGGGRIPPKENADYIRTMKS
jgi:hypothetical protein